MFTGGLHYAATSKYSAETRARQGSIGYSTRIIVALVHLFLTLEQTHTVRSSTETREMGWQYDEDGMGGPFHS